MALDLKALDTEIEEINADYIEMKNDCEELIAQSEKIVEGSEMDKKFLASVCMNMVSNAGEGRNWLTKALDAMLKKNYEVAETCLEIADKLLGNAQSLQFGCLQRVQARGVVIPLDLLMLHSMDMYMIGTSERDMLTQIVRARI
ncbi:MAG: PTS lactose/cellobiose transporter subunit IIA [Clostridiaceae bacterium]